ncbi:Signal peptidase I [Planctomycetales bacterium 10988]|nr:Signal peptidase I [Planctomycetales bacterium 10988]
MARKKRKSEPTAKHSEATSQSSSEKNASEPQDGFRDIVESIVIAFILAFLFRTFEAEAFVIPTGSMAPTLMGRHKDLVDPATGYPFAVGASKEVNDEQGLYIPEDEIWSVTSPLYAEPIYIGPENELSEDYYSYSGDRILVSKTAYLFRDPRRWEVIVFHYPERASQNYIKRCIGTPNEELKIFRGDIFVRENGSEGDYKIARKPPEVMKAMLQIVHDNDYQHPLLNDLDWPNRWKMTGGNDGETTAWERSDDRTSFTCDASAGPSSWLRYQHVVPTSADWQQLHAGLSPGEPKQRLVTDLTYYNTSQVQAVTKKTYPQDPPIQAEFLGVHWVSDLAFECDFQLDQAENGKVTFEFVQGEVRYQVQVSAAGELEIFRSNLDRSEQSVFATGKTTANLTESTHLFVSNIDQEIRVWLNRELIPLTSKDSSDQTLQGGEYFQLADIRPYEGDLEPIGIQVEKATIEVSHLKVWRDIYYSAKRGFSYLHDFDNEELEENFPIPVLQQQLYLDDLRRLQAYWAEFQSDPSRWDAYLGSHSREFQLEEDQFFVLGDNSPLSLDGRLWNPSRSFVDRNLLIGRALLIYWPHGWETPWHLEINAFGPQNQIRLPFYPNFRRMNFIR